MNNKVKAYKDSVSSLKNLSNLSNNQSNIKETGKSFENENQILLKASMQKIKAIVCKTFKQKYNGEVCTTNYNNLILQTLLYNKNTQLVSKFKDYMIYDYIEEFLKRQYLLWESSERIPKMSKYYNNYLKFFCHPVFRNFKINGIIQNYGDDIAEIYYVKNYGKENSNVPTKKKILQPSSVENNNKIFDNTVRNFIDGKNEAKFLKETLQTEYSTIFNINSHRKNELFDSLSTSKLSLIDTIENIIVKEKKSRNQKVIFTSSTSKNIKDKPDKIVSNVKDKKSTDQLIVKDINQKNNSSFKIIKGNFNNKSLNKKKVFQFQTITNINLNTYNIITNYSTKPSNCNDEGKLKINSLIKTTNNLIQPKLSGKIVQDNNKSKENEFITTKKSDYKINEDANQISNMKIRNSVKNSSIASEKRSLKFNEKTDGDKFITKVELENLGAKKSRNIGSLIVSNTESFKSKNELPSNLFSTLVSLGGNSKKLVNTVKKSNPNTTNKNKETKVIESKIIKTQIKPNVDINSRNVKYLENLNTNAPCINSTKNQIKSRNQNKTLAIKTSSMGSTDQFASIKTPTKSYLDVNKKASTKVCKKDNDKFNLFKKTKLAA